MARSRKTPPSSHLGKTMAQPEADVLDAELEGDDLDARIARLTRELLLDNPAAALSGFEPWKSQRPFFYDDHMVCYVTGGNKSGKDYILCTRLAIAVTRIEPLSLPGSLRFVPEAPIFCRYYVPVAQTWEKSILPMLLEMIPVEFRNSSRSSDGSGYNQKDCTVHLVDGGWIQGCTYTAHKQDESRSQAVRLNLACLSEVPPQDLHDQLTGARTILEPGAKVWGAMTMDKRLSKYPMGWVRKRIIMGGDGPMVTRMKISTVENVYGMAALYEKAGQPEKAKALIAGLEARRRMLPPQDYAAQVLGEWAGMEGIVYNRFDEHDNAYLDGEDVDPQVWRTLADKGYGIIEAGWDYGKAAPTSIQYYFLCREGVEDLQLVEGDVIQFAEYYRAGARVPEHLLRVIELHKQLRPSAYFFDPHMDDSQDDAPSVIKQYVEAMSKACGPINVHPGNNSPGSVDAGVEFVARLLTKREEPFPWPQLRVVVPRCPNAWESYICWALVKGAENMSSGEKYEEEYKHANDCTRYFLSHHGELRPPEPAWEQPRQPLVWLIDGERRRPRAATPNGRLAAQMNSMVEAYRALA